MPFFPGHTPSKFFAKVALLTNFPNVPFLPAKKAYGTLPARCD
jgi:hypothetical protein